MPANSAESIHGWLIVGPGVCHLRHGCVTLGPAGKNAEACLRYLERASAGCGWQIRPVAGYPKFFSRSCGRPVEAWGSCVETTGLDEEPLLACNGIAWGMTHAASGASKCLGGALIHAASQATKLELIVVLSSEGWESRNIATTPVRNHGPWLVSLSMVQRSKKYFEALVEAQSLFSRGVTAIAHGMPDNY